MSRAVTYKERAPTLRLEPRHLAWRRSGE